MQSAWLADYVSGCEVRSHQAGETVVAWGVPSFRPAHARRVRVGGEALDEVLARLWAALDDIRTAVPYARLRVVVRLVARARLVRSEDLWPQIRRDCYTASTMLVGPLAYEEGIPIPWSRIGSSGVADLIERAVEQVGRYERVKPDDLVSVRIHLRKLKFQPKTVRRAMHRSLEAIAGEWMAWWIGREPVFVKHVHLRGAWWQVLLHDPDTGGESSGFALYVLRRALALPAEGGGVQLLVFDQVPKLYAVDVLPRLHGYEGPLAGAEDEVAREAFQHRVLVKQGLITDEEWERYGLARGLERRRLARSLRSLVLVDATESVHMG
mgnify:CR=1 FL=1